MSWEAESWARQQRTGDPVTKAVLVGIANWMNPKGDPCPVSMRRLADEVEISTRTAQRHIQRLEAMGLVEKSEAHREDGGQGWNTFRFPTYRPPKVSHVEPAGKRAKPPVNLTPPHDNLSPGEGDNLSPSPPDNLTGGRASQPCHGEGDNGVTPERGKGENNTPPTPPDGGEEDAAKRNRGSRIADDWAPPSIEDLPASARAKARQWPPGAYEAEAEAFRNYWLGEGRAGARKIDWNKTWYNRINEVTARVLRDAKAGVRFTAPPPGDRPPPRSLDSSRESTPARNIRAAIRSRLGDQLYEHWIGPSRLDVDGGSLSVVAASAFTADYLRNHFANEIGQAMHAILGPDAELSFSNERPAP